MAAYRVCDAGIRDEMLGLIHGSILGLKVPTLGLSVTWIKGGS